MSWDKREALRRHWNVGNLLLLILIEEVQTEPGESLAVLLLVEVVSGRGRMDSSTICEKVVQGNMQGRMMPPDTPTNRDRSGFRLLLIILRSGSFL